MPFNSRETSSKLLGDRVELVNEARPANMNTDIIFSNREKAYGLSIISIKFVSFVCYHSLSFS